MNSKTIPICLLGATGFLGSAIAQELDKRGIEWVGISRDESDDERVKTLELTNKAQVLDVFNKSSVVINAIGSAKPKDYEDNPAYFIDNLWNNVTYLSELLKEGNVNKLIHISSAGTVYGEKESEKHSETSPIKPISWYGKAKVIEELFLEKQCFINDCDYLCVRVTNPYGNKNKTKHGFIDVLINTVLSGSEFSFYEDCNPVRDFIYSEDMAFSIVELNELQQTGIFNLGSGNSHSLKSITDYVIQKLGNNHSITRKSNKPDYDVLNNEVCVKKLSDCQAKKASMDVYTYIDSALNGKIG